MHVQETIVHILVMLHLKTWWYLRSCLYWSQKASAR